LTLRLRLDWLSISGEHRDAGAKIQEAIGAAAAGERGDVLMAARAL
jgi:hypothetical protein